MAERRVSRSESEEVLRLLEPANLSIDPLVRVGGAGDGGYWLPNDFHGVSAVFSPGVGTLSNFELFFARLGITVFMVDHTVKDPPIQHELFHFDRLRLGRRSVEDESLSLVDWVKHNAPDGDLILQIDIEGSEYEVLLTTSEDILSRFRIIVLELHDITSIATRTGKALVASLLHKLRQSHVVVVSEENPSCRHLYSNGLTIPNCVEVTLWRKDRVNLMAIPDASSA